MLFVGLRLVASMVDDAIPMIRRRIERVQLHGYITGIDDVMICSSRDESTGPSQSVLVFPTGRPPCAFGPLVESLATRGARHEVGACSFVAVSPMISMQTL